jgi:alkylation response protein AidB-like acyl-CoA dehydrogenase
VNFALTAQQEEWRDRVRRFVATEVAPRAAAADIAGRFPREVVAGLAELGLLAGPADPLYGGGGLDYQTFAIAYEELGRGDAAVRGFLSVHAGLVAMLINDHGSPEQKREWLPRLASGDALGCYCLTEPEAGSDAAAIGATATRRGDRYVLRGRKWWITNGSIADLAVVFARDTGLAGERPHRQLSAFMVPAVTPGFERRPMELEPLGHRAADHAEIQFRECEVPSSALLGEAGGGFRLAMAALDHGRLGVAAGAVGLGQSCLDAAMDFARARRAFGRPVADFGAIRAELADLDTRLQGARMLTYRAAWLKDEGRPSTYATAQAKLAATEAALAAADWAVLVHGARGYDSASTVARHWRDAKGMQIYEGTSHIQRLVVARMLLDRPPEAL